jgi:hypothetical protein
LLDENSRACHHRAYQIAVVNILIKTSVEALQIMAACSHVAKPQFSGLIAFIT